MDTEEEEHLLGDLVLDCQPLKRWGIFRFLSAIQGHVAGRQAAGQESFIDWMVDGDTSPAFLGLFLSCFRWS